MSKIELEQINDNEVEVILPAETPLEIVQQLTKGLAARGLVEDLYKSTLSVRYFSRPTDKANTVADQLIKSLQNLTKSDDLPYWHPKAQIANQARVREMDIADRRAKLGIKQPTNVSPAPQPLVSPDVQSIKPPVAPSAPSVNTAAPKMFDNTPTAQTTAGGSGKRYAYIHDPVSQSEHVEGCQCDKCLEMNKSGYGPKGSGQYNPADNARRKSNNVGEVVGSGPNVNTKQYTTAKYSNQTPQTDSKIKRPQPVKSLKEGTLNPSIVDQIKARAADKVNKSWGQHMPFPNAEEEMIKLSKANSINGEEAAANQLLNLMMGKSMLGIAPPPQPTNEEMFGGGVVTEEMAKAADNKWNNTFNNWMIEAQKPISQRFKSDAEEAAFWAGIKVEDRD